MPTRSHLLRTTVAIGALAMLAGCAGMRSSSPSTASTASAGATPAPTARIETYDATLSSAAQVPPNSSTGAGRAEVLVDPSSYKLRWRVSSSGLSGPPSAGHIHGPAAAGANAGVVVPFTGDMSNASGEAQLTPAQYADLAAGLYYVNVHTSRYPGGEIRGQLRKRP